MATKKQKRERGAERAARRMQESIESGLRALADDRQRREEKLRDSQREKHDKQHSWKKIEHDCLLCQDKLKAERKELIRA